MPNRRGITLIELMAAMGASAVLLAVAVGLMQVLLRTSDAAREQVRTATTVGRLAEQFRADVHQASGVRLVDGELRSLELTLSGRPAIAYRIRGETVERQEGAGPAQSAESPFPLPGGAVADLEVRQEGAATIVSLTIQSDQAAGPALRIDAVLPPAEKQP